jgi:hypothetical protein
MGYGGWSSDAYDNLSRDYSKKSADDIFTNNKTGKAANDFLPVNIKFRESRDSAEHPRSVAVMVNLDVTGSMGKIPEKLIKENLGVLMDTIINHDVKDAQILFGAIGDHYYDKYPLQVGQFESETDKIDKSLTSLLLEGGGGGSMQESYLLAWLFAARHTSIDCFEKRNEKGILFTIGDEMSHSRVEANTLKDLMGYTQAEDFTDKQLLEEVKRMYHVFHIHVNEASYKNDSKVLGYWKDLLNERLIVLDDHNRIAEIIASTVAVMHGADINTVVSGFSTAVALTVKNALANVNLNVTKADGGIINL